MAEGAAEVAAAAAQVAAGTAKAVAAATAEAVKAVAPGVAEGAATTAQVRYRVKGKKALLAAQVGADIKGCAPPRERDEERATAAGRTAALLTPLALMRPSGTGHRPSGARADERRAWRGAGDVEGREFGVLRFWPSRAAGRRGLSGIGAGKQHRS